jgi:tRNA(Leu) C34 or U34 (ribose-2'-O)-methylase TrmL
MEAVSATSQMRPVPHSCPVPHLRPVPHSCHARTCADFQYQPGDWLVFGAETSGLPPEAHRDVLESGGALVKIPIRDTYVR